MATGSNDASTDLLESSFRVPEHVVYRSFAHETVILNLKTGKYHGLNPTAGTMLAVLERGPSVREAAVRLAEQYERPVAEIERDLCGLCVDLLERGLIEPSIPDAG
jgi:hypothetical protein